MALLDNYPSVLREVLNYPYERKVSEGKEIVRTLMVELVRTNSRDDSLDILLTLVIYAVSSDHGVDEKERLYFNSVFSGYRQYYSLEDFHAALRRVNGSFYYDRMFSNFKRLRGFDGHINCLFWLFCVCNGTVTADELNTFNEFMSRLE